MPTVASSLAESPADLFRETRLLYWLWSTDHRRVALLQLLGIVVACLGGGLVGLALQVEKSTPELHSLSSHAFAAAFSLHGAVLVFLLILPAIPGVVGAFLLPSQIGARNLAFPRLHLMSVQLWTVGALCFLAAMGAVGAVSGWTLSVPLSLEAGRGEWWLAAGFGFVALSILLRSVVLMTSVLTLRRRGLSWSRISPLVWSLLAQGAVTLIAAPVVLGSVVALLAERAVGLGLFDPALGGDPLLFQNFFWFGMHALVYSTVVPAVGLISHVLASAAPGGTRAPRSLLLGLVGLSLISLMSWGMQSPTAGHGIVVLTFFSLITLLGAVPMSQIVGSWLLTLRGGFVPSPAAWCALAAAGTLILGALATLPLATLSTAVSLHGTAYEVGQSHLIFGGVALAALSGLLHFWPEMTGRRPSPRLGAVGALLLGLGLPISFMPQLALGLAGLPRRMSEYPAVFAPLQQASLLGTVLVVVGGLATAVSLRGEMPSSRRL